MRFTDQRLILMVMASSLMLLAVDGAAVYGNNPFLVEVLDRKGAKTGIYKKVIVNRGAITSDNPLGFTKLYREPSGGKGEIVDPFSIFFRVKTTPENGYLRVGDAEGKPLGWIKEKNLIPWNTRFCLRPTVPPKGGVGLHVRGKGLEFKWQGDAAKNVDVFLPVLDKPTVESNPQYAVALFSTPAKQGTCKIRSDKGVVLAETLVMVSQNDLRRLRSTLDLLLVELSDDVNSANRGNTFGLIERLKVALVVLVTGQDLDGDTPLELVISSLPLKTATLKLSAKDVAEMNGDSFEKWLDSLNQAKQRCATLLGTATAWKKSSGKAHNHTYAYIRLKDLP